MKLSWVDDAIITAAWGDYQGRDDTAMNYEYNGT
jgi:hypothetical protein